jgi:hypothetical protein
MFIGHFGLGFGGKRPAPAVSLGTLFLAAQFLDLLWPTLVLLGIETVRIAPGNTPVTPLDFESYPYSHSLLAALLWAFAFGSIHWLVRRRPLASVVLGSLVFSHWVLDFISHRPDLQLAPGSGTRLGLGLWYSRPATIAVELALLAGGALVYSLATRAGDRVGRYGYLALLVFLAATYLMAVFGPPPPSVSVLAWSAQSVWLLVAWGYWIDRHRQAATRAGRAVRR